MFSSFKKVRDIVLEEGNISKFLLNANLYWAHTHDTLDPELLEEHTDLVNNKMVTLVDANCLDPVIDRLVDRWLLSNEVSKSQHEIVGNFLKLAFVRTVTYHDFGKVNPNFQADKQKMNNPTFYSQERRSALRAHHSKLGSYLYLVNLFKEIQSTNLTPKEAAPVCRATFFLSYSILKHHSPRLEQIDDTSFFFSEEELDEMSAFLESYQIHLEGPLANFATKYWNNRVLKKRIFDPLVQEGEREGFSLYALCRLNFSLLTASDYLATSEYMNGHPVDDFGLIANELRERVLKEARNSEVYNAAAFTEAATNKIFDLPQEKNAENLNRLRLTMAAEAIRVLNKSHEAKLFYLEAPTGGGKTNISMLVVAELLRLNPELNKVFYVFPFTTLITQTHLAIKKTLGLTNDEVCILHSKAGFQSKEDDDYGGKKRDYLNNLFVHYPFCLITHVRFFDILKTNEKETNYLMHRLANSIVVIDELQSYPPMHWDKMLYFIEQYSELFNIRFILMSATLPRISKLNLEMDNRPEFVDLLPDSKKYFTNPNFADRVNFRFDYRDKKLEMDELAFIVLKKSKEYQASSFNKSVFAIVEFIFKKSTTEFYNSVERIHSGFFDEILILSGTILESRRKEIINFLKNPDNRSKNVLLITTQVVEAGVDIDMDLGFKNISLIDSDEQLAGRVNRNILKPTCEVYLFQSNDPGVLYKKDLRYEVTRELDSKYHEQILSEKSFDKLYNEVISQKDKVNGTELIENFSTYSRKIQILDFKGVHEDFKLIDQETLSIFVPIDIPKYILSKEGNEESVFSPNELQFLISNDIVTNRCSISGEEVWRLYKLIIKNSKLDFSEKAINKKMISGILSKYTFSVFASVSIKNSLGQFIFPVDEENPLGGFENYFYLAHFQQCYDYEKGLMEDKLNDSANLIL